MTPVIVILSIVIIVIIAIVAAILFLTRGKPTLLDQEKYRTEWLTIENGLDKNNAATFQFALLAADKLLDQALTELKADGETIEERIRITRNRFVNGVQLAAARKLMKQITGRDEKKVNITIVRRAVMVYKKALKELGAI